MEEVIKFPENFLWGSATSAYQVEGGIENNDWAKDYPAGLCCDHYHLYEQDFDLIRDLGQNAHRLSIEWARIEPEEGKFDQQEINHYRGVFLALKARGIKIMVTLHHFTSPLWLADKGGFANSKSVYYFLRFAEKVFTEYRDLVDFWVTINEPLIYVTYCLPLIRPEESISPKLWVSALKTIRNQILSHRKIYQRLHQLGGNKVQVGLVTNNSYLAPYNSQSLLDKLSVKIADYLWNEFFLNRIKDNLDFIGLNYYFSNKIKFPFSRKNECQLVSDLGWGIVPEGIYHTLMDLREYRLPIYITENGLADSQDRLRKDFIRDHLYWTWRAIENGADVRGYFYWSLLDNLEWDKGFDPRFGLVEMNYETMERILRPSAYYYAKICKANSLIVNRG